MSKELKKTCDILGHLIKDGLKEIDINDVEVSSIVEMKDDEKDEAIIYCKYKLYGQEAILLRVELIPVPEGRVLCIIQWLEESMVKLHLCGVPTEEFLTYVSKEALREIRRLRSIVIKYK